MSTLAELAVEEILKSSDTTLNYLFPLLFETNILLPAWIYHRVTMWWLKYNKDSIFDKMVENALILPKYEKNPVRYWGPWLWEAIYTLRVQTEDSEPVARGNNQGIFDRTLVARQPLPKKDAPAKKKKSKHKKKKRNGKRSKRRRSRYSQIS